MSGRPGYRLTAAAQNDRAEFEAKFGDRSNCSCHLHPPCGSCVHAGNPNNQAEDDTAWEPIPSATDEERANKVAAYVNCLGGDIPGQGPCGLVALTATDYEQQLERPNRGWLCPHCGGQAEYNDTESERVQGVNDEEVVTPAAPTGWPYVPLTPERRASLLKDIEAAIDEPMPDGLLERANVIMAATQEERAQLGVDMLMHAALFVDDMRVAHPDWDDISLRRVASDAMARALMLLVRSARLREGRDLSPGRAALASYFVAADVLEVAEKRGGGDVLLDVAEPGLLRAAVDHMAAERVPS